MLVVVTRISRKRASARRAARTSRAPTRRARSRSQAVEAAGAEDELAGYLEGLPPGVGLLVVRHGPAEGSSFRLEAEHTNVGRHPDSEIFLDDITVSRRHVVLDRTPKGYLLRDVGSLNGTYVNRERADEAILHHGDELQIGRYRLSFVLGVEPREE